MKHLPTAVASFHTPHTHIFPLTGAHTLLSSRAGSEQRAHVLSVQQDEATAEETGKEEAKNREKKGQRGSTQAKGQLDDWAPPVVVSTMPLGLSSFQFAAVRFGLVWFGLLFHFSCQSYCNCVKAFPVYILYTHARTRTHTHTRTQLTEI